MSASNSCVLLGRITRDIVMSQSPKGAPVARFTIAVRRSYKEQDGQYGADFIQCLCYGPKAQVISKHFQKGSVILVQGEWRTGSYEKDGRKIYTSELSVTDFSFTYSDGSKSEPQSTPAANTTAGKTENGFVPESNGDYVPFEDIPFT